MHKLLLLIVLFFSGLTFAQTVKVVGRCTDKRGTPLESVRVYAKNATPIDDWTDAQGMFELTFQNQTSATIFFKEYSDEGGRISRDVVFNGRNKIDLGEITFAFQLEEGVIVQHELENPFDIDPLPIIDFQKLPMSSIPKYLTLTTAAVSNNELTNNYNVRGGSFDENLIYVNGFNIYRPFLTRSGQQEGMSFINTALVDDIKFSAGGFNAEYGDKLSSVLDIAYKKPDTLEGSLMASLLGVESHVGLKVNSRLDFLAGARYRSNGYLLNALPTKGAYNPVFWDAQMLINYDITEQLTWSTIGHFSSNNFRFIPQTSQTDFGTANEAYSFTIYFDGQEQTRFQTMMGGTALKWESLNEKTHLDFYTTVFNTDEREYFDIQGQYFINELETDPSKEEFGDSIAVLGIGTFLNHARNRLNATIVNAYHQGDHTFMKGYKDNDSLLFRNHSLKWGVNFQMDDFYDVLSEWKMVDSAGYSVPQSPNNEIELFETIKGQLSLKAHRYTSFVQFNSIWSNNEKNKIVTVSKKYTNKDGIKETKTYTDTIIESPSKWALTIGARSGYTTANNEFFVTPRASVKYYPRAYMIDDGKIKRRDVVLKLATGMYYQPPFYREFRTFSGDLNLNVLAQKSIHVVGGTDVFFNMWNREVPFKFSAEAYYKYMWDVNTYEIENVRTRYYANNDVVGYAYGLDLNIYGQFVDGIESFFKVGILQTKEDVLNDSFWEFYNAAGEKIIFGYSEDQTVVDSAEIFPGYIPRPTDQLLNFGALIQDRMPKYESFSVQMGMNFGSRLPYGPPDFNRYKDTLRIKSYFRVDVGMSYDFLYKYRMASADDREDLKENFFTKRFSDAVISFEVFNLLGVNNVLSKQWIQDVNGTYYSIPNYLTQRRFNLKLILRF
jgi:hypothetical protein